MAGVCSRVDRWAGRLVLLLCLAMLCVRGVGSLVKVPVAKSLVDMLADGILGLVLVQFLVLVAEARLRRQADRLEAADAVRYP